MQVAPAIFYVMANPINYAQNSGFPSVISWRAVDFHYTQNDYQINSETIFGSVIPPPKLPNLIPNAIR